MSAHSTDFLEKKSKHGSIRTTAPPLLRKKITFYENALENFSFFWKKVPAVEENSYFYFF